MIHYCAWCGEEFGPVEHREVPAGEDEFCSDLCEDALAESLMADQAYDEGRYGGAPVF